MPHQLDEKAIASLKLHSERLFNLKHGFRYYLDCVEGTVDPNDSIGLACFGVVLLEYFENAKKEFNELQTQLEIAN